MTNKTAGSSVLTTPEVADANPDASVESANRNASDTPRTDAFTTSIYNAGCAAQADMPSCLSSDVSPEDAYGMAVDLAQSFERETIAKGAEIARRDDAISRVLALYDAQYLIASVDGTMRVTHTMNLLRAVLIGRRA